MLYVLLLMTGRSDSRAVQNLLVYPVAQGKLLNLVIFHTRPELEDTSYDGPWSEEVDESELSQVARFSEWEPEAQGWMKVRISYAVNDLNLYYFL